MCCRRALIFAHLHDSVDPIPAGVLTLRGISQTWKASHWAPIARPRFKFPQSTGIKVNPKFPGNRGLFRKKEKDVFNRDKFRMKL